MSKLLLHHAIGDSYGVSFEYSPVSHIDKHNTGIYYSKHPRHPVNPGNYSDDTQMALAIAESLIDDEKWNKKSLANKFVEVFKRDPRPGYSHGFYLILQEVSSGDELLSKIDGKSDKSGAAMRATPLGLCDSLSEINEKCTIQASVTHNSPDGIAAALAASYMVYYFHKNIGKPSDLPKWLGSELGMQWAAPWDGKVQTKGWMSVRAAITAISRNTTMENLLMECINFTGDVDTVAAIALAAASCSLDYFNNLNENLILGLENNNYGRDYIINLDKKLSFKYD